MACSTDGATEPLSDKMQSTKYRQLTLGEPRGSSVKDKKQKLKEIKGTLLHFVCAKLTSAVLLVSRNQTAILFRTKKKKISGLATQDYCSIYNGVEGTAFFVAKVL